MSTTTIDQFANTGSHLYLHLAGMYYRRDPKGWVVITDGELPATIRWAPLHSLQRQAYEPVLRDQGLIKELPAPR